MLPAQRQAAAPGGGQGGRLQGWVQQPAPVNEGWLTRLRRWEGAGACRVSVLHPLSFQPLPVLGSSWFCTFRLLRIRLFTPEPHCVSPGCRLCRGETRKSLSTEPCRLDPRAQAALHSKHHRGTGKRGTPRGGILRLCKAEGASASLPLGTSVAVSLTHAAPAQLLGLPGAGSVSLQGANWH